MTTTQRIAAAALALFGATSAFAGGEFDPLTGYGAVVAQPAPAVARAAAPADGLTRAQVKAELAQARVDGTIANFDVGMNYAQAPRVTSTLTREQVREDTRLALRGARAGSGS